ncbi:MAG: leucine-rich repeat protein [Bacilli bacterium]|nr:leucine-rich repeat protein [Bacilli bacterium]
MALKFCPNCGKQNTFGSNFCSNCGTNLQDKSNQEFEIVDGVLKKYNGKNSVVRVPNTVRTIDRYAFPPSNPIFGFYSSIEKIYLPSSVKELDDGAFNGLTALRYVDMPNSIEVIGAYAFQEDCSLEEITIPSKVTKIPESAFDHCLNLKRVNLPEGIQEIEGEAFRACVKMTSIRLPRSVKRVESDIFFDTPIRDIYYSGTKQEFKNVFSYRVIFYYDYSKPVTVHCLDGTFEFKRD